MWQKVHTPGKISVHQLVRALPGQRYRARLHHTDSSDGAGTLDPFFRPLPARTYVHRPAPLAHRGHRRFG